MSHIRENKDDFYSSFESVSKSENESENLIECCARYFQGAAYNTDSVDVCIAAIVKTLGVNLNLFQKDPVMKLMTLSKYDCNEYNYCEFVIALLSWIKTGETLGCTL